MSDRRLRFVARCWPLAAVIAIAPALAGCSVEVAGVAGVGVDATGRLVGYIQMCDHHVDGATLYRTDDDTLGEWKANDPVTGFARWSLPHPADGWTAQHEYSVPTEGVEYSLYGWTEDNNWSAQHVTFRLSDLDGSRPGDVLYWNGKLMRVSETDFRRSACEGL